MTLHSTHPDGLLLPGRYRHYKGREYEVIGLARHCGTEAPMVVYRCLYGDYGLWLCSQADFEDSVELSGEIIPRFAYIGPVSEEGEYAQRP